MFELLFGHSLLAFRAGEPGFARGWPLGWLALLVLAGLALVVASLWRQRHLAAWRLAVLAMLQLLFVALLLLLLWRPVLTLEHLRERENVVAIMIDDSPSMTGGAQPRRQEAIAALSAGTLAALRSGAQLRYFSFADRAEAVDALGQVAAGKAQSRIGDSLHQVLQTAGSMPLAAVILVSDGADTGGSLGEERLRAIRSMGIPVHTIGVGPLQAVDDLELAQLAVNDSAAPNQLLQAQVSIRHQDQRSARLRVHDGGRLIAVQDVQLTPDAGITTATVRLPAGAAGLHDLRFELDPLPNERNRVNNGRHQVLDVSGQRRNVLYIEGEPRWEYKFIRRAVDGDKSLRLASLVRATPNRYYRQGVESPEELADGFPADAAALFAYDAVVIGSFAAATLNATQHQALKDFVDRRGASLLLLAGRDGLGDGGWGRATIGAALPAQLPVGSARNYGQRASKVRVTSYGAESPVGKLAGDPARDTAEWNGLPALSDLQPLGPLRPGATVLLEAVTDGSAQPLLVTQRYGRGATYLFGTASTWHWQMGLPHEDARHELFWRQLLQTLAAQAPARASLQLERKVIDDDPSVPVEAQVYDAQFRPVNDAQVSVRVAAENGTQVEQRLLPSGRGDGRYSAVLSADAPGLYRLEMTAQQGKVPLGAASMHLRRNDGVAEHFEDYQHRAMLERIAADTGGRYWTPADLRDLPEAIRYSKAGVIERETIELWNVPAGFLLLLLLKTGEWLLRRRWSRL